MVRPPLFRVRSRPPVRPPLFGFRVGEVAWHHPGGTWDPTPVRITGQGAEPGTITVTLTPAKKWRAEREDVEVSTLLHGTPAFYAGSRAWAEAIHHWFVASLPTAVDALVADNPHLLVPRVTWEGGPPHSRAVCLRAALFERESASPQQLEVAVRALRDPEILDHVRRSAAALAVTTEMQEPKFNEADRATLRRIAAFRP